MPPPPHRTPLELISFCEDIETRIKPGVLVWNDIGRDIGVILKVEGKNCPRHSLQYKWKATVKWNSRMKIVPLFMNEFEAGWVEILSENL